MKRMISAALGVLAFAGPSVAQIDNERLAQALVVEWIMANCQPPESIGITMMAASMIINGSEPTEADALRKLIRDGVKDNYSSTDDACADLMKGMK